MLSRSGQMQPTPDLCEGTQAADAAKAVGGVLPRFPARYSGPYRAIPRMSAAELSSSDWYWRFARTGAPVIITDAFDPAWLQSTIDVVVGCSEREYEDMFAKVRQIRRRESSQLQHVYQLVPRVCPGHPRRALPGSRQH